MVIVPDYDDSLSVIASEAKQSSARHQERMDCRVASLLATTLIGRENNFTLPAATSAAGFCDFDYCAALLTSGAPSASTLAMSSRLPVTALVTVSLNALCTAGHCGK